MAQKKSIYHFDFQCDPGIVQGKINQFLSANQFKETAPVEQDAHSYVRKDFWVGKSGFDYALYQNHLVIYAYIGTQKRPRAIDDGAYAAVAKAQYRDMLSPLMKALNALCNDAQSQGQMADGTSAYPYPQNTTFNEFEANNAKKKETFAVIGFVMSLIQLMLSLFGVTFGVLIIMLEFYFAKEGLHTSKKGLAVATFAIGGVSLAIFVVLYICSLLLA